ncbi:MAG: glucose-1-phosphate adenylyltransferase subunit GlgD [Clostridia bacterium]|nr:glucose-1-phosphate adenylyltransferase subunit GlgD [Clostridia bacterium]
MRASNVAGVIFGNTRDLLLGKLTGIRSMASVPFGSRYRLIDFTLSNFVNAGITNIGVVTNGNYRSLMDHIGSGIAWDLDRKNKGLHIILPYETKGMGRYTGSVDAIKGSMDFIDRCHADYIVICESNLVANIDFESVVDFHIKEQADVTVVYAHGKSPEGQIETMITELENGRVVKGSFSKESVEDCDYTLGVTVIGRKLLKSLIEAASMEDIGSLTSGVLAKKLNVLKILGYRHNGFATVIDSPKKYFDANMSLLSSEVREDLFNSERPVFTKTRDDMPTRYGTKADVKNCFIANGCVIDGTVKNSILFRGVKVEKGAVVENSIIMQGGVIEKGANLKYVISDKNAVIGEGTVINGTENRAFFIEKNQIL